MCVPCSVVACGCCVLTPARRLRHARSPADSATGCSRTNRASLVSRRIHRLLRVPPTGSSASVSTKNIASCDFFLAGLRPLVLTRPSGPGAHNPIACAPGLYESSRTSPRRKPGDMARDEESRCIREGLPMSREPALLTSVGRMPERSQHRVSEGHGWP